MKKEEFSKNAFRQGHGQKKTKCNSLQFESYYFTQKPQERESIQDNELSLVDPALLRDMHEPYRVIPQCPYRFRLICQQIQGSCDKIHFVYQNFQNTDFSLGDCSYLESCRHTEACKYVHYQLDPQDQKTYFSKMRKIEKYSGAPQNPSSEKKSAGGWVDFQIDTEALQQAKIEKLKSSGTAQWINCDLQSFDMGKVLVGQQNQGDFDVLIVDPPWDIHMNLPYETISDQQVISGLKGIDRLQKPGGLIFLWVTGRATELGIECLEHWGYKIVEEIVWVKINQLGRVIRTGMTGHWLNHTKEHCLVGVKGGELPKDLNIGIDCDVIVSEVRETSRKPDELYEIIDRLRPNGKKLEIFARENNLRDGWFSLGNQLPKTHIIDKDIRERFNQ